MLVVFLRFLDKQPKNGDVIGGGMGGFGKSLLMASYLFEGEEITVK